MGGAGLQASREGHQPLVAGVGEPGLPQPPLESAEETERARPMREVLGVQSAGDQLTAALKGREWLVPLADELS